MISDVFDEATSPELKIASNAEEITNRTMKETREFIEEWFPRIQAMIDYSKKNPIKLDEFH